MCPKLFALLFNIYSRILTLVIYGIVESLVETSVRISYRKEGLGRGKLLLVQNAIKVLQYIFILMVKKISPFTHTPSSTTQLSLLAFLFCVLQTYRIYTIIMYMYIHNLTRQITTAKATVLAYIITAIITIACILRLRPLD